METIIQGLTSQEIELFRSQLKANRRKHKSANLELFDAYLNNSIENFKSTCNANSFYVFQKRLKDKLIEFIADQTINEESTEEIPALKQLIVARKLLLIGNTTEGMKCLKKAEAIATSINHLGILNEVYQTNIQYSEHLNEEEILALYKKLKRNNGLFLKQEKLNLAYSMIRSNYRESLESSPNKLISDIFNETIEYFNLNKKLTLSFKQLYQLAEIVNLKALQEKNFEETDLFFIKQFEAIIGTPLDNEDSAPYHIKTLLAIANIYFRRKQFNASLKSLKRMEQQLVHYPSLTGIFEHEAVLLKALNLNFIGEHHFAATLLDQYLNSTALEMHKTYNVILVRIMIHLQQDEPKQALSLLATINVTDHWIKKHVGIEWLLNKKYIEILLHIELDNLELVDARINSLLKSHKAYFVKNQSFQIIPFLNLVKQYFKDPSIIKSNDFKNLLENSIISKPDNNDDLFFICFYAWLKAKVIGKDLYSTTISLINP